MLQKNEVVKFQGNLFDDIIKLFDETPYDIPAFSFHDYNKYLISIYHNNVNWLETYVDAKLYEIDPVCDIKKNYFDNQEKNIVEETLILTYDDIHYKKRGSELREARRSHSLNSGGITLFMHDNIIFSVGYWSSQASDFPGVREYFLDPNKLEFMEEVHGMMIDIYNDNKDKLFLK